jgi:MFS family permease
MGLGSPVFGWISDLAGYRWMYRVAGLALLVSTAVFMLKAPATGRRRQVIE